MEWKGNKTGVEWGERGVEWGERGVEWGKREKGRMGREREG